MAGYIDDLVVVEIKSSHGITRFRLCRFFFDGQCLAGLVELHDAIALRVFDWIGEYGGAVLAAARLLQVRSEIMAVKNVVAQYQGTSITADKIRSDHEGLGDAFRFGLRGITDRNPPLAAIAEQLFETRRV